MRKVIIVTVLCVILGVIIIGSFVLYSKSPEDYKNIQAHYVEALSKLKMPITIDELVRTVEEISKETPEQPEYNEPIIDDEETETIDETLSFILDDNTRTFWYHQTSSPQNVPEDGFYEGGHKFAAGRVVCEDGGYKSMGSMCPLYAAAMVFSNSMANQYDPCEFAELSGGKVTYDQQGIPTIDMRGTWLKVTKNSNVINMQALCKVMNDNGADAHVININSDSVHNSISNHYYVYMSTATKNLHRNGGRHYIVLRIIDSTSDGVYVLDSVKNGSTVDIANHRLMGGSTNTRYSLSEILSTESGRQGIAVKSRHSGEIGI